MRCSAAFCCSGVLTCSGSRCGNPLPNSRQRRAYSSHRIPASGSPLGHESRGIRTVVAVSGAAASQRPANQPSQRSCNSGSGSEITCCRLSVREAIPKFPELPTHSRAECAVVECASNTVVRVAVVMGPSGRSAHWSLLPSCWQLSSSLSSTRSVVGHAGYRTTTNRTEPVGTVGQKGL